MTKENELTDYEKGAIVALSRHFSHAEIANELGRPRRTVSNFLQRTRERGSIENLPRAGRPRKLSDSDVRLLVRDAEKESRVPFRELANINNFNVSEQTIRRRLREEGIRKWRAVGRPLLTREHAKKRLAWARAHQHWSIDDWNHVIWSDESAIQKDSNAPAEWISRRQTMREKYDPKNVRTKSRDSKLSQMIWACFVGEKLGPILFFTGTVNQDVYMKLLEEHLEPFIVALKGDSDDTLWFQQDNARPHTAKKTQELLEVLARKHGLKIME